MALADRTTHSWQTVAPNVLHLAGTFLIGAAGAITSQTGAQSSGATVAFVASGLYTVTYYKTFAARLGEQVTMSGPDSAAFPAATGSDPKVRVPTTAGFSIQLVAPASQADANGASGTRVNWSSDVVLS